MRRPLTKCERLVVRLNIAVSEALRPLPTNRLLLVNGVFRGSWRHWHDNTAGSLCYRMRPHYHVHYCTNHPQPVNGLAYEPGEVTPHDRVYFRDAFGSLAWEPR